ncbi:hypothetical protein ACP4OV_010709 [Aristida adscensionis]
MADKRFLFSLLLTGAALITCAALCAVVIHHTSSSSCGHHHHGYPSGSGPHPIVVNNPTSSSTGPNPRPTGSASHNHTGCRASFRWTVGYAIHFALTGLLLIGVSACISCYHRFAPIRGDEVSDLDEDAWCTACIHDDVEARDGQKN